MAPLVRDAPRLLPMLLGPARPPRHPLALARFGLGALEARPPGWPARASRGPRGRALFAGSAAHSMLRLDRPATASFGLVLVHARPRRRLAGGPRRVAGDHRRAWPRYLRSLGGEIRTGHRGGDVDALPPSQGGAPRRDAAPGARPRRPPAARALPPRAHALPLRARRVQARSRRSTGRSPGRPRSAAGPAPCTSEARSRRSPPRRPRWPRAGSAERPFVLVAQQSPLRPRPAPPGRHTLWAYCHVPNGSDAPTWPSGSRPRSSASRPGSADWSPRAARMGPADMERHNPNYVGGDINGGARTCASCSPAPRCGPCPTPPRDPALFICSSSTPPGGGVHGMCGYSAARPCCGAPSERQRGGPKAAPLATSLGSVAQHLNVLVSVPFAPSSAVKVARMSRVLPLQPIRVEADLAALAGDLLLRRLRRSWRPRCAPCCRARTGAAGPAAP